MLVILSLVPMVSAPPLLPPEPPLPSPPPQAVRAMAVIAMPAPAASARRPPLETDLIRYLVFMGAGRGAHEALPPRPPVGDGDPCLAHSISRASGLRRCCYAVVTGANRTPSLLAGPPSGEPATAGRLSAWRPRPIRPCSPSSPRTAVACSRRSSATAARSCPTSATPGIPPTA